MRTPDGSKKTLTHNDIMLLDITYVTAFLGGLLTLLPACGPFVLPAFFAIAFSEKERIVLMTFIFLAGFLLVFIPFGLGVTFIVGLWIKNLQLLHSVAGLILIVLGVMTLFEIKIPGFRAYNPTPENKNPLGIFVFGMTFAVATGACTAPTIGAVLTTVVASGVGIKSVLLLVIYALGLIFPLIVLAIFYDKISEEKKQWIFRKKILNMPLTNLFAAMLFIGLGILYLVPSLQFAAQRVFEATGFSTWILHLYTTGKSFTESLSPLQEIIFFITLLAIMTGTIIWSRRRKQHKKR